LRLPPGYHAHLDPDVLVLGRTEGSVVARFSSRGLVAEEVERAAWEDYVAAGGGRPQDVPLAGAGPPPLLVLAPFLVRLARSRERRSDGIHAYIANLRNIQLASGASCFYCVVNTKCRWVETKIPAPSLGARGGGSQWYNRLPEVRNDLGGQYCV
jgi:hypothetical protein